MYISYPSIALSKAVTIAVCASLLAGCSSLTALTKPAAAPKEEPAVAAQPAKPELPPPPEPAKRTKLFEWTGEGRAVTRIVVNVDEQKARFYEGDKEVGWTTVASGVSHYPTPVGSFSVQEKVANKESNLYGKIYGKEGQLINSNAKKGKTPIPDGARFDGADMPYFLRLTGDGIGMHAGPIPRPGRPASHGCIRMPKAFAPIAFRHVGIGTQVSIVGKGPTYSAYLAQQRASAPRPKPSAQTPAQPPATSPATAGDGATQTAAVAPQSSGSESATDGPLPVAAQAAPSAAAAPADAPKVPAVAHNPEPPVAPAIATRAEPIQGPAASGTNAPTGTPQAAPQTRSQGTAAAPGGGSEAPSAPAAVAGSAYAPGPAAPAAVYYPTPQVPAYRAPVPPPAYLAPPAAAVAAQPMAPAQVATPARVSGTEQKAQSAAKAVEPPAAAAQPKVQDHPEAQPAAPAPSATPEAQGAG